MSGYEDNGIRAFQTEFNTGTVDIAFENKAGTIRSSGLKASKNMILTSQGTVKRRGGISTVDSGFFIDDFDGDTKVLRSFNASLTQATRTDLRVERLCIFGYRGHQNVRQLFFGFSPPGQVVNTLDGNPEDTQDISNLVFYTLDLVDSPDSISGIKSSDVDVSELSDTIIFTSKYFLPVYFGKRGEGNLSLYQPAIPVNRITPVILADVSYSHLAQSPNIPVGNFFRGDGNTILPLSDFGTANSFSFRPSVGSTFTIHVPSIGIYVNHTANFGEYFSIVVERDDESYSCIIRMRSDGTLLKVITIVESINIKTGDKLTASEIRDLFISGQTPETLLAMLTRISSMDYYMHQTPFHSPPSSGRGSGKFSFPGTETARPVSEGLVDIFGYPQKSVVFEGRLILSNYTGVLNNLITYTRVEDSKLGYTPPEDAPVFPLTYTPVLELSDRKLITSNSGGYQKLAIKFDEKIVSMEVSTKLFIFTTKGLYTTIGTTSDGVNKSAFNNFYTRDLTFAYSPDNISLTALESVIFSEKSRLFVLNQKREILQASATAVTDHMNLFRQVGGSIVDAVFHGESSLLYVLFNNNKIGVIYSDVGKKVFAFFEHDYLSSFVGSTDLEMLHLHSHDADVLLFIKGVNSAGGTFYCTVNLTKNSDDFRGDFHGENILRTKLMTSRAGFVNNSTREFDNKSKALADLTKAPSGQSVTQVFDSSVEFFTPRFLGEDGSKALNLKEVFNKKVVSFINSGEFKIDSRVLNSVTERDTLQTKTSTIEVNSKEAVIESVNNDPIEISLFGFIGRKES